MNSRTPDCQAVAKRQKTESTIPVKKQEKLSYRNCRFKPRFMMVNYIQVNVFFVVGLTNGDTQLIQNFIQVLDRKVFNRNAPVPFFVVVELNFCAQMGS